MNRDISANIDISLSDGIEHLEGTAALEAYVDAVGYFIVENGSVRPGLLFKFGERKPEEVEVTSTTIATSV